MYIMMKSAEKLIQFGSSDIEKYRQELCSRVQETMAQYAIRYIVGISGDADLTRQMQTEEIIEDFVSQFQGKNYAVLTGGTEGGVPQLGVETAKRLGIPTIGVFPKQGRKYALSDSLDVAIETSPPDIGDGIFGTETPTFVNMLDGATIIGGSYGTLTEAATILKTNAKRARDRSRNVDGAMRPLYFAPIAGTGGAADLAYAIARDTGVDIGSSMPQAPTTDGVSAAQFIAHRLEEQ